MLRCISILLSIAIFALLLGFSGRTAVGTARTVFLIFLLLPLVPLLAAAFRGGLHHRHSLPPLP